MYGLVLVAPRIAVEMVQALQTKTKCLEYSLVSQLIGFVTKKGGDAYQPSKVCA